MLKLWLSTGFGKYGSFVVDVVDDEPFERGIRNITSDGAERWMNDTHTNTQRIARTTEPLAGKFLCAAKSAQNCK